MLLLPLTPAAADPPTPTFGALIDVYEEYDGQDTCGPAPEPGVLDFRDVLLGAYPRTGTLGISRACHIGGRSEHKEGRAWDWAVDVGDPADVAAVEDVFEWLFAPDSRGHPHALARRFGLMYIIWNRRIWKAYPSDGLPAGSWHAYTGANPHTNHVHFSFAWPGALRQTTWWSPSSTRIPPTFSSWYNLAGGLASAPAVLSPWRGRIGMYAIAGPGADSLHQRFWEGRWSEWLDLGHPPGVALRDKPAVVSWRGGERIDVFARGQDGNVWQRFWESGSGWTSWYELGGDIVGGAAAVSPSSGRIDVYAIGGPSDDELVRRSWNGGWSAWTSLGRPGDAGLTMTPSVVLWDGGFWAGGRLDIFARATDGSLRQKFWDPRSGSWSNWHDLGGLLASGPAAVSPHLGRIDVFTVAGTSGHELHRRGWEGSWGPWVNLKSPSSVPLTSQPGAARWDSVGRVDVFTRGHDGAAWQVFHPDL